MLPIEPDCHALIINCPGNSGEVLVDSLYIGCDFYTSTDKRKWWIVDRPLLWQHNLTGEIINVPYCLECHLMRIDGGDFKTTDIGQYQSKPCTEIVA